MKIQLTAVCESVSGRVDIANERNHSRDVKQLLFESRMNQAGFTTGIALY